MDKRLPHEHGKNIECVMENVPCDDEFKTAAEIFRQLCDGTRIKIFWLLCHCEECVINISAMTGMSSPAVSHHLRQLRACGLILSRREGKEVYYRAADTEQAQLLHKMIEKMVEMSCPDPDGGYASPNAELAGEVRDFLVANCGRRFTIEELAKKYLISTSALKAVFKSVYGRPIAAYMKEYRMRRAMELLRTSDSTIAEIAEQVGYESQGKFTKAFKESAGMPPSEYRRARRK